MSDVWCFGDKSDVDWVVFSTFPLIFGQIKLDSRFLSSCHQSLTRMCVWLSRVYARGSFGVKPPLELDILQKLCYLRKGD